ncbi:MAG: DUF4347 domain-containing protein [Gammaproteobacteria bacterium]|nr:DUF4347 domain-containing protein [Gammaproteobacteria bacterium]
MSRPVELIPQSPRRRRRPIVEAIERRILLSADLPGLDVIATHSDPDPVLVDYQGSDLLNYLFADPTSNSDSGVQPEVTREIVFIDETVPDYQILVDQITHGSAAGTALEIVTIDSTGDGIAQISEFLSGKDGIDAVHIITHGQAGELSVGGSELNLASLDQYRASLSQWAAALSDTADILLYGCDVAADADGRALVEAIAAITGADVAASEDRTGATTVGADWQLEFTAGAVTTSALRAADDAWGYSLASVTVSTTNDIVDGNTGSIALLIGSPGADGKISLREAVIAANQDAAADTINLASATYTLTRAGDAEQSASTGDLDIVNPLTIVGTGVDGSVINASAMNDRVFEVLASGSLTLSGLTVTGGNGDSYSGGAVRNAGVLSATDVVFAANQIGNADGGTIDSSGTTTLTRVSIIDSVANRGGALNITGGTTTVQNATFSNNTSAFDGGAIRIQAGTLNISFSTVAGNTATGGWGGALEIAGGTVNTKATIYADNTSLYGGDIRGTLASQGLNIIENSAGITGGTAVNDFLGSDPSLGTLTHSATGQYVHPIDASSIAADAGVPLPPSTDQRNVTRDGSADIGAYEYSHAVAPSSLSVVQNSDGGLSLNENGGNSAYLKSVDPAVMFSGLTATTVEVDFSISTPASSATVLLSLASATDPDELALGILADGHIAMQLGSGYQQSASTYNELFDGQRHRLSVSWVNSSGTVRFYVDGVLKETIAGYRTGVTLDGAGSILTIGQDQDTLGGGFDPAQTFKGVVYDVRVFNDVRTDQEVFSYNGVDLPHDAAGLIGYWKFDNLTADGEVADLVAGFKLQLAQISSSAFTADDGSLVLSVDEHSAIGTVVGTVAASDAEREGLIAILLGADPDLTYSSITGKFYKLVNTSTSWTGATTAAQSHTLNGISGELVSIHSAVENEIIHDYADAVGNAVWLAGSDVLAEGQWRWYSAGVAGDTFWSGTGSGYAPDHVYQNWYTNEPNNDTGIDVAGENYLYMSSDGTWNDVFAGAGWPVYVVQWDADEVLDATQSLIYAITAQTSAGAFSIDADSGVIQVADGSLLDFDSDATHTLTVQVTDADGNQFSDAFTIALNDTMAVQFSAYPIATQNLIEDGSLTFSNGNGNAVTVSDSTATNATLQLELAVANGRINLATLAGLAVVAGADGTSSVVVSGSESALNAALEGMVYTPTADFAGTDSLAVKVALVTDLLAHYEFESAGANDSSVGGLYDGVITGDAAVTTDAERGSVLTLDGTGDGVTVTGRYGDPTTVTLAAWVNLTSADTYGSHVISIGNAVVLALDRPNAGEGVHGSFYNGTSYKSTTSGRFIATDGWHHVAYVIDDANDLQQLYIDGELVSETAYTASVSYATATTDSAIGTDPGGSSDYDFAGDMDDVRIYTRALTADEVHALAMDVAAAEVAISLDVSAVNDAPVADHGGAYAINEGEALFLDASGSSDAEGDTLTYRWDLDNDGQYDDLVTTAASNSVSWATLSGLGVDDDGVYTIGLQVTDGNGGVTSTSTSLTISNVAPVLTATGSATTPGGAVYTLTLSDIDPGNDTISSWIVNWGDGAVDTYAGDPSSVTHTYANVLAGRTLDITVSATDEDGQYFEAVMLVPAYGGDYVNQYGGYDGTLAGSFAPSTDGIAGHANIVVMPTGNYLVSGVDSGNIVEYQPNGALVGDFVAAVDTHLANPGGLAYGPDGNLYVADYGAGKVVRFDGTTGAFIDDFVASGLSNPLGLEFGPDGKLYVANRGSAGVLRYDAGSGALDAGFVVGSISNAEDLTFGPDGNIYGRYRRRDSRQCDDRRDRDVHRQR